MADNPLSGLISGIADLPLGGKILLGGGVVGAGYLAYKHAQNQSNTTAASTSDGSSLPVSGGDTTGISGGGYSQGGWWGSPGPVGPPIQGGSGGSNGNNGGPAGPPIPFPSFGFGSSPGGNISPIGPAQALTASAVQVGGPGGISQGILPTGGGRNLFQGGRLLPPPRKK